MSKILVTAFEPFALSGFLRKANASNDILNLLRADFKDGHFLKLPVSVEADKLLRTHLDKERPDGILCMGEDLLMLPGVVKLEPFAYDCRPTLNFLAPKQYKNTLASVFAQSVTPTENQSTIGTYYCNSLYKTALQWAAENGAVPVGFTHVSVLGNRKQQSDKVMALLGHMSSQMAKPG